MHGFAPLAPLLFEVVVKGIRDAIRLAIKEFIEPVYPHYAWVCTTRSPIIWHCGKRNTTNLFKEKFWQGKVKGTTSLDGSCWMFKRVFTIETNVMVHNDHQSLAIFWASKINHIKTRKQYYNKDVAIERWQVFKLIVNKTGFVINLKQVWRWTFYQVTKKWIDGRRPLCPWPIEY